jgi:ankyrin repeat protein
MDQLRKNGGKNPKSEKKTHENHANPEPNNSSFPSNIDNDVNKFDEYGRTLLHCASLNIATTPIEVFRDLIEKKGANINLKNKNGQTPINLLFRFFRFERHIPIIKYILSQPYVDVLSQDSYGQTPLHYACVKINILPIEIFKLLIYHVENYSGGEVCFDANGTGTGTGDEYGNGSEYDKKKKIEFIMNFENNNNQTPLHLAFSSIKSEGNGEILEYLVQLDAEINANAMDNEGFSILHLACKNIQNIENINENVPKNKNVEFVDSKSRAKNIIFELITRHNGDIMKADSAQGNNAIHAILSNISHNATTNSITNICDIVIEMCKTKCEQKSANFDQDEEDEEEDEDEEDENCNFVQNKKLNLIINSKNKHHFSPLHFLACHIDVIPLTLFKWFVEYGADINSIEINGKTPLHIAFQQCYKGINNYQSFDNFNNFERFERFEIFEKKFNHKNNHNEPNQDENLTQNSTINILIYLSSLNTIKLDIFDNLGSTAFHYAASNFNIIPLKIFQNLLLNLDQNNPPILHHPNKANQTPITCALLQFFSQSDPNILYLLINHKTVDVNRVDGDHGCSIMHHVCQNTYLYNLNFFEFLFEKKSANIDLFNLKNNNSLFHYTFQYFDNNSDIRIVDYLYNKVQSPRLITHLNNNGDTCVDVAFYHSINDIPCRTLLEYIINNDLMLKKWKKSKNCTNADEIQNGPLLAPNEANIASKIGIGEENRYNESVIDMDSHIGGYNDDEMKFLCSKYLSFLCSRSVLLIDIVFLLCERYLDQWGGNFGMFGLMGLYNGGEIRENVEKKSELIQKCGKENLLHILVKNATSNNNEDDCVQVMEYLIQNCFK